jgi:hypothetical protein
MVLNTTLSVVKIALLALTRILKVFLAFGEEYSYIFRNGEWVCYNMHEFEDNKRPEIVEIPEGALAV